MKVYIGYDSSQAAASAVCEYSIQKYLKYDIQIVHLKKQDLIDRSIYFRPEGDPASTDFTYTRFLVPYLNDYQGYSMFVDSDFLFRTDLTKLFDRIGNDRNIQNTAVYCVQHMPYNPKQETKFWGNKQHSFPRKNWSSLMIFNNSHEACKRLTPLAIANQTPQWLHRMYWCRDNQIGNIDLEWNWLVGEYDYKNDVQALHFTNGGPWNDVWGQDYENEWLNIYEEMTGLAFSHGSVNFKI